MTHSANPKTSQNLDDMIHTHRFETVATNTKKLRKIKELENETRCRSARSHQREGKDKEDTSRTRSVSPTVHISSPGVQLPLKKFYNIYSKIVTQLETVKSLSESKRPETENLVDLRRQLRRADEFSIRFSRNNLYETKRIISEVKKLVVPYPFETLSPEECKLLCKKIILGYQAASQSLQTYVNYVKNPSNLEIPEKINELILLIADLFLCCEHLSLPPDEVYIQNDAIKICNELMVLLNSKIQVTEYAKKKEDVLNKKEDLAKKRFKMTTESTPDMRKFSMYRTKLTTAGSKVKLDCPKKAYGISSLLANRSKRMKKKDEKKARITHDIYTQKLNMNQGKEFGKAVKFEPPGTNEKGEVLERKQPKRSRYFTPREVRSQDDDVETMVQTIGDDEVPTSRLGPTPWEADEGSDVSSNLNRNSFRELLLEAIEELKSSDKKEQKSTLKKLLNSIQNCSKSNTPRPPKVKVYHFKSKDLEEEEDAQDKDQKKLQDTQRESVDLLALHEEQKARDEILSQERRLSIMFKPLKAKRTDETSGEVVPRGKIKLKLPEESMISINNYRRSFHEYTKNNIMYKKTLANKPWQLLGKVSDRIILDIVKEIAKDFQNDAILRRLYLNELLEVAN